MQDIPAETNRGPILKDVPVFPLPNVVLLPRTILPLHIFEQRYRIMTEEALAGPRLIAMAMLKPGYEPLYHTPNAEIRSVVGFGRILREERLADGRFNILLQGLGRGRITEETCKAPYRKATLETLSPCSSSYEFVYRHELLHLVSQAGVAQWSGKGGWLTLFNRADLSFSDLVDVVASSVLAEPSEKQSFLEEVDVCRRAKRLCAKLSVMANNSLLSTGPVEKPARVWPPASIPN
jgi:uncharacterized protein